MNKQCNDRKFKYLENSKKYNIRQFACKSFTA